MCGYNSVCVCVCACVCVCIHTYMTELTKSLNKV